jgi:hypothetical protein
MPNYEREVCPHCGGLADPTTTCPRALECPVCHAAPGASCKRPSGHRAPVLHQERIDTAEAIPPRPVRERAA